MIRYIPAPAIVFDHECTPLGSMTLHEIEAGIHRKEYLFMDENMQPNPQYPIKVVDKNTLEVLATVTTTVTEIDGSARSVNFEIHEVV